MNLMSLIIQQEKFVNVLPLTAQLVYKELNTFEIVVYRSISRLLAQMNSRGGKQMTQQTITSHQDYHYGYQLTLKNSIERGQS